MDEHRLEHALRQGPPFATRYLPSPLGLDEELVDRPFGVVRPLLLVAVTVLLVMVWLAGLGAIGGLPDRGRDVVTPVREFVDPFIGLPPPGATASTPETGQLVFSLYGRMRITRDVHGIWVYADGRLIWRRSLEGPDRTRGFGANEPTTGVVEQRLTSEGVEILRSEAMLAVSGLPRNCQADNRAVWAFLEVREGERLVRSCAPAVAADRLADFGSWLPPSAWADQRIGGYVPSRYGVCIGSRVHDQSYVIERLPEEVRSVLESRAEPIVLDNRDAACTHAVSTDDARAIAEMLNAAGVEHDPSEARRDEYIVVDQGASIGYLFFDAFLPDGELVAYPA